MARGKKTGGRVAGTPNKVTGALKEMILGALQDSGGQEYLKIQGQQNPTAFLSLLGKVLPLTLAGDKNNPIEVNNNLSPSDNDLIQRYFKQKEAK